MVVEKVGCCDDGTVPDADTVSSDDAGGVTSRVTPIVDVNGTAGGADGFGGIDAADSAPPPPALRATPTLANARASADSTADDVARCTAERAAAADAESAPLPAPTLAPRLGPTAAARDATRSASSCSRALAKPRRSTRSLANCARISARRASDIDGGAPDGGGCADADWRRGTFSTSAEIRKVGESGGGHACYYGRGYGVSRAWTVPSMVTHRAHAAAAAAQPLPRRDPRKSSPPPFHDSMSRPTIRASRRTRAKARSQSHRYTKAPKGPPSSLYVCSVIV